MSCGRPKKKKITRDEVAAYANAQTLFNEMSAAWMEAKDRYEARRPGDDYPEETGKVVRFEIMEQTRLSSRGYCPNYERRVRNISSQENRESARIFPPGSIQDFCMNGSKVSGLTIRVTARTR